MTMNQFFKVLNVGMFFFFILYLASMPVIMSNHLILMFIAVILYFSNSRIIRERKSFREIDLTKEDIWRAANIPIILVIVVFAMNLMKGEFILGVFLSALAFYILLQANILYTSMTIKKEKLSN